MARSLGSAATATSGAALAAGLAALGLPAPAILVREAADGGPLRKVVIVRFGLDALVDPREGSPQALWDGNDAHHLVAVVLRLLNEDSGIVLVAYGLHVGSLRADHRAGHLARDEGADHVLAALLAPEVPLTSRGESLMFTALDKAVHDPIQHGDNCFGLVAVDAERPVVGAGEVLVAVAEDELATRLLLYLILCRTPRAHDAGDEGLGAEDLENMPAAACQI
mmetsp:Transcript_75774/g.175709  ORF Transcript_75774/g.175709 Transcript_75774/m.175709 type:complete len:223 (+) Transcript_75774:565-1233(+)